MTREEYLQALRAAFTGMPEEDIEGVLAYYGEMIDDRMEAGMTEEAAVRAMEDPAVVASRVRAENGGEEKTDGEAKKSEADSRRKEIRRPAAQVTQLHIQAENIRVQLTAGESDDIVLRYTIGENDVFRLHEDEGVLTLEHQCVHGANSFRAKREAADGTKQSLSLNELLDGIGSLLSDLGRTIAGNGFGIAAQQSVIEVELPRTYHGGVRVNTSNARISMSGVTCKKAVALYTSNARIQLEDVTAASIGAKSSNGRIEVLNTYAREDLQVSSSNARIHADGAACGGLLSLTTSNGRVEIASISGADIRLRTSNGAVSGTVKGEKSEYTVASATSNGSNNLGAGGEGEKKLQVVTSNGAINVTFVP